MLRFILGEFGTGKTVQIYEKIKKDAEEKSKIVFLVPEQLGFISERNIYDKIDSKYIENIFVTSFTRLYSDVISKHGKKKNYADEIAKKIIVKKALNDLFPLMEYYAKSSKKSSFPDYALSCISSFKNAGITPQKLTDFISSSQFSGRLGKKLDDLLLIYKCYENELQKSLSDHLDDPFYAAKLAFENDYFKNKNVFIDSFDGFTGAQYKMLEIITKTAANTTLCISTDSEQSTALPFVSQNSIFARFLSFSEQHETTVLKQKYKAAKIEIISASDVHSECDFIAAKIRDLTINNNYLFNDILILTRDDFYQNSLKHSLEKYDIQSCSDLPKPLLQTPLIKFVLSIFDLVSLESDAILKYIKSGFVKFKDEKGILHKLKRYDVKKIEDFINKFCPKPTDFSKPLPFEDIEDLRKKIILPIIDLKKKITGQTGDKITEYFSDFLINELNIKSTIQGLCKAENNQGELKTDKAMISYYRRVWEAVVTCFESIYVSLKNYPVSIAEYKDFLCSAFLSESISSPPQTLDFVEISELNRTRADNKKVVFICGMTEGKIPSFCAPDSAFTTDEIEQLFKADFDILDNRKNRFSKEYFIINKAFGIPSDKLFLTYPKTDNSYAKLEPSQLISDICREKKTEVKSAENYPLEFYCSSVNASKEKLAKCFKDHDKNVRNILSKSLENEHFLSFLNQKRNTDIHKINAETAKKIISEKSFSPTSLDCIHGCFFKYFCEYVLKIKEPVVSEINPVFIGNAVHFILSKSINELSQNIENQLPCDEEIISSCKKNLDEFCEKNLYKSFAKNNRFFLRLYALVPRVSALIKNIMEDIKITKFIPSGFEEKIELNLDEIKVCGICDRYDFFASGSKKHLRVIDYKTGIKTFNLDNIFNGIDLQLLIYLIGISEKSSDIVPALSLYVPAGEDKPIKTENYNEKEQQKAWLKAHIQSGVVVAETSGTAALTSLNEQYYKATGTDKRTRFFNLLTLNDDDFKTLKSFIKHKIIETIATAESGIFNAKPVITKDFDPCKYCKFSIICGYKKGSLSFDENPISIEDFKKKEQQYGC